MDFKLTRRSGDASLPRLSTTLHPLVALAAEILADTVAPVFADAALRHAFGVSTLTVVEQMGAFLGRYYPNKGQVILSAETFRYAITQDEHASRILAHEYGHGIALTYGRVSTEALAFSPRRTAYNQWLQDWSSVRKEYGPPTRYPHASTDLDECMAEAFMLYLTQQRMLPEYRELCARALVALAPDFLERDASAKKAFSTTERRTQLWEANLQYSRVD